MGETRILTGRTLAGPAAPSRASTLHVGAAFGDALERGLSLRQVASFDELDAPFFRSLGDYLRSSAAVAPMLAERLWTLGRDPRGATWQVDGAALRIRLDAVSTSTAGASLGSLSPTRDLGNGRLWLGYRDHPGWRFGPYNDTRLPDRRAGVVEPGNFTDDGAFANPFLSFARNGVNIGYAQAAGPGYLRIAAVHGTAQVGERRDTNPGEATGVLTEYRFGNTGVSSLAIQTGWLTESQRLVGSRPSGAFGGLGSKTGIVGLSAHRQLGARWSRPRL